MTVLKCANSCIINFTQFCKFLYMYFGWGVIYRYYVIFLFGLIIRIEGLWWLRSWTSRFRPIVAKDLENMFLCILCILVCWFLLFLLQIFILWWFFCLSLFRFLFLLILLFNWSQSLPLFPLSLLFFTPLFYSLFNFLLPLFLFLFSFKSLLSLHYLF